MAGPFRERGRLASGRAGYGRWRLAGLVGLAGGLLLGGRRAWGSSGAGRWLEARPLTSFEALSLLIAVLGLVGAGLSVLYVLQQLHTANHSLRMALLDTISNQLLRLDQFFVENPAFRPYFFANRSPDPLEGNSDALEAVCDYVLDIFLAIIQRQRISNTAWPDWNLSEMNDFIRHVFEHSPMLRKHFQTVQGWYPPELIALWREACQAASAVPASEPNGPEAPDQSTPGNHHPSNS